MKTFEAKGTYTKGRKVKFTKKIKADNEKLAREYTYSLIGGKQKITRKNIDIEDIKEAK